MGALESREELELLNLLLESGRCHPSYRIPKEKYYSLIFQMSDLLKSHCSNIKNYMSSLDSEWTRTPTRSWIETYVSSLRVRKMIPRFLWLLQWLCTGIICILLCHAQYMSPRGSVIQVFNISRECLQTNLSITYESLIQTCKVLNSEHVPTQLRGSQA